MSNIIAIKNLKLDLITARGVVHAVRDINMNVKHGEIHGVVGESGCGKSMTAKAILRLHDEKKLLYSGSILYEDDKDIFNMTEKELQNLRGKEVAMIFQDPITTLNPLLTIGQQLSEVLTLHLKLSKKEAKKRSIELLESVEIHPGAERYEQYPFEMSGGMLQRVIIAMAIACNPKIIIADEPTTALDVTMQAQVLDLIKELRDKHNMAVMIITHNFGVVAEICDTVSVMYAGKIVETGEVSEIFHNPKHPYTQDLIKSIPKSGSTEKRLVAIPGSPPDLRYNIEGCPYASRCTYATEACEKAEPKLIKLSDTHAYTCIRN